MRNTLNLYLAALMAFSMNIGCDKKNSNNEDAQGRLQGYISKSLNIGSISEKADLLGYLTGDAKDRLQAWSDEQFKQAFIDTKRTFVKLVFQDVRSPAPDRTSITYELIYIDRSRGKDTRVTYKKLAQMVNEGGKWQISDVKNIRELIEYRDEMALP